MCTLAAGTALVSCSSSSYHAAAATPQAAAVGFDQALRHGGKVPFDCLPNGLPSSLFTTVVHTNPTADARRVGSHWNVTVTYRLGPGNDTTSRYGVRREGDGYCVNAVLDG